MPCPRLDSTTTWVFIGSAPRRSFGEPRPFCPASSSGAQPLHAPHPPRQDLQGAIHRALIGWAWIRICAAERGGALSLPVSPSDRRFPSPPPCGGTSGDAPRGDSKRIES